MNNFINVSNWNAIHYAASASLSSVIDPLLLAGADINCAAKDGTTPLHIAAKLNASNFASALIGFGAYVDAQDSTGATPLHYAAAYVHPEIVKMILMSKSCDLTKKTKIDGKTAFELKSQ